MIVNLNVMSHIYGVFNLQTNEIWSQISKKKKCTKMFKKSCKEIVI